MGGPNFPHLEELQPEFLRQRPLLDAYVYLDGEVAFGNDLVDLVFSTDPLAAARDALRTQEVKGCAQLTRPRRI